MLINSLCTIENKMQYFLYIKQISSEDATKKLFDSNNLVGKQITKTD